MCFYFFPPDIICSAGSERKGSNSAVSLDFTFFFLLLLFFIFIFFVLTVCQCHYNSRSSFLLRIVEIYQVLGESKAGTPSPWTCNILWTTDEQAAWLIIWLSQEQMTDNGDEEMASCPSPCPREREAIDFSMMAHNLSIPCMPVGPPVLGGQRRRTSQQDKRRWLQKCSKKSIRGTNSTHDYVVSLFIEQNLEQNTEDVCEKLL